MTTCARCRLYRVVLTLILRHVPFTFRSVVAAALDDTKAEKLLLVLERLETK